jgi:transposase
MRVPGRGDFWSKCWPGGWRPAGMPRPYSQDLRDRVVVSVAGGRSRRATAKIFSVSVATVVRWSQRFRTTGSAAALAMGGRRPHRLAGRREWLLARIADKPDLTLRAILAELAADGVKVSHGALWAFFARDGITFKKRACTPANRTAPTSPAGASGGRNTRAGLTPNAWSSSTRPGPRPT